MISQTLLRDCIVVVEEVSKKYNENIVVDNISFTIRRGDNVYLSGVNGAGKTTTLKLLAGLIHPDSGFILYGKQSLFQNEKLRKKVGYMTTEAMFYEALTVEENLKLMASLYKVDNMKDKVDNVINLFNMSPYKKSSLNKLSSGMKGKFQIAAAIIHEPDLLILDEPFNTLDEESIKIVKKIIKCNTVIFTTHNRHLADSIATRELAIQSSQIKEI
jgi:ABC-2 type transport system ATP-binding protein